MSSRFLNKWNMDFFFQSDIFKFPEVVDGLYGLVVTSLWQIFFTMAVAFGVFFRKSKISICPYNKVSLRNKNVFSYSILIIILCFE